MKIASMLLLLCPLAMLAQQIVNIPPAAAVEQIIRNQQVNVKVQ